VSTAPPPAETSAAEHQTVRDWARAIRNVEGSGDYFQAFELARKAIAAFPEDESLKYLGVRALARSGAAGRALELYDQYGLKNTADLDIQMLRANLVKDIGLRARSTERWALLRESAALYEKVYDASGDHFPAANAATLYVIAGAADRAKDWARRTLRACDATAVDSDIERYYQAASRVEANLVLGDIAAAREAMAAVNRHARGRHALRAATRRQLRLLCAAMNVDAELLRPITPPGVMHYTGHMVDPPNLRGRFPPQLERQVAADIGARIDRLGAGFAYGSLACGADLLCAEACLERGIEVNVVLPFNIDEFKRLSVERGGPGWVDRFERCLAKARSLTFATEGEYLGDEMLFAYGSQLAMGLAILRAHNLEAETLQLAVWDGEESSGRAGTSIDVRTWAKRGRRVEVVDLVANPASGTRPPTYALGSDDGSRVLTAWKYGDVTRELHAIMFGDVVGFSHVPERLLPMFQRAFMARISETLDGFGRQVLYRNSWGDAVYAILDTPEAGARCALAIQTALKELNLRQLGFTHPLELRLAVHYGPIFRGRDFLTKAETFFGAHVTRAARIEPVTPPGEVFVTEAMAAALALGGEASVRPEYVGSTQLAKNYGSLKMYVLRPELT
jgi:class 3 adenylate cyclase/tetratricopeptide (TPR) repeat protein